MANEEELDEVLFGQKDIAAATSALLTNLQQVSRSKSATCWILDVERNMLWSPQFVNREDQQLAISQEGDVLSSIIQALSVANTCADCKTEIFALKCDGSETFGAVVICFDREAVELDVSSRKKLTAQIKLAAPLLVLFIKQDRKEQLLLRDTHYHAPGANLYRSQALNHRNTDLPSEVGYINKVPRWLLLLHALLLLGALGCVVAPMLIRFPEEASGPMIIRNVQTKPIVSLSSGIVVVCHIQPGDSVHEGELAIRLQPEVDNGYGERLKHEIRIRSEGVIRDVYVTPGQQVRSGQIVATMSEPGYTTTMMALFPGSYAPLLREGLPLTFRIAGYPDTFETTSISRVFSNVLSPEEVENLLGRNIGQSIARSGPVVVIYADLLHPQFTTDGHTYNMKDGMTGEANVQFASRRLVSSIVPELKVFLRRWRQK